MTPRNFGFPGQRDDSVSLDELLAGICLGLILVCIIGACFLARSHA